MGHSTETAVDLRRVSAAYGSQQVLHAITAAIPAHRATALVGPNGSGKSTLLGVIAGLHQPGSGAVERFNRERPALVVQRSAAPDTLPITVADTVAMGRWAHRGPWRRLTAEDRAIVRECMARLDIAGLAGRPLGALSGGQRQRALLAQGLAQRSDLLLLDEPSAGLDTAAHEAIMAVLAELRSEGVTVVFATHDLQAAQWADHRLHLRAGTLAEHTAQGDTRSDTAAAPATL